MEIYFNDLSIHNQFHSLEDFENALEVLLEMVVVAKHNDRTVYFNSKLMYEAKPTRKTNMHQALSKISKDKNKIAFILLSRGPFWDEEQRHSSDEYFVCRDKVVTDSGIGEAAFQTVQGIESSLVSITPSDWNYPSVKVSWIRTEVPDEQDTIKVCLDNWVDPDEFKNKLQKLAPPIRSWAGLSRESIYRFTNLTFSDSCFEPLYRLPFAQCSANQILKLLQILNEYAGCIDSKGKRTWEGHRIYNKYFTGDQTALFSDSSDTEKKRFREKLMFPHPGKAGNKLFCPWHGKVRHLTLRIHFKRIKKTDKDIYIAYVGEKLTKQ